MSTAYEAINKLALEFKDCAQHLTRNENKLIVNGTSSILMSLALIVGRIDKLEEKINLIEKTLPIKD